MPVWTINALLSLLAHAPEIEQSIEDVIKQHWGKDHVQQAVKGVQALNRIVTVVAAAVEPPVDPAPAQVDPAQDKAAAVQA